MEATSRFWFSARIASSLRAAPKHRAPSLCAACLHTSAAAAATPVAHPSVPGPPPQAPQAAPSYPQDRVARKRQQADLLHQGQQTPTNPAKPGSALTKRFWRNVAVRETAEGGLQVLLDSRPVRTASRQALTLPKHKRALAAAIALEWDQLVSAQQALKQHYVPLTSLTSRALDLEAADRQGNAAVRQQLVKTLMRYLGTDTLLCWAPETSRHDPMQQRQPAASLRQRQKAAAAPIIAYLTTHVFPGVEIVPILGEDSIVPTPQPAMTREVMRGWAAGLPPFELAALERAVLATKSFCIAARLLVEWSQEWAHLRKRQDAPSSSSAAAAPVQRFGIEQAAEAASLEVLHQTEQWGQVEDTHDVEHEDIRRQLGSAILLVA